LTHVQEFAQDDPKRKPIETNYHQKTIILFDSVAKLEVIGKNLTKDGFERDLAPIKKFKLEPPPPVTTNQNP